MQTQFWCMQEDVTIAASEPGRSPAPHVQSLQETNDESLFFAVREIFMPFDRHSTFWVRIA